MRLCRGCRMPGCLADHHLLATRGRRNEAVVPRKELNEAAVLASRAQGVVRRGAGRSQGVGEAAAAVAPGPDLDLLVAGLGHEPYQRPRREAAVEPASAYQHRDAR